MLTEIYSFMYSFLIKKLKEAQLGVTLLDTRSTRMKQLQMQLHPE